MKICLTGATGFIGKNLLSNLSKREDVEVIALSRRISPLMDNSKKGNVVWRRCNGFSMIDVEKATEGADILIYLIHSMLPSSSLSQGSFEDFDLYLADNFARACQKNGVKKIIYLSGIIPENTKLSEHLLSRLEVEKTLSQYNNDLTVLRASLIVGKNGSSFKILERLVKRLPVLICPRWTLSNSQPIDLEDVLFNIEYCISNFRNLENIYDIGGADIINYREMLKMTAQVLNIKRIFFIVPAFSPFLSKLWVSKVSSTSNQLVYPLIDSLRHEMIADPKKMLKVEGHKYKTFLESLQSGVTKNDEGWVRAIINYNGNVNFRWLENVTSFQRISNPGNFSATEISEIYFSWLSKIFGPILNLKDEGEIKHIVFLSKFKLLSIIRSVKRSDESRVVFYITGGALARKETLNGRLEFRPIYTSGCIVVALLDFRPALPWFIYKFTQALFHLFIMKRFEGYLRRKFARNS